MDYTSIISRNMAVMIDVCVNDQGSTYKRRNYERVLEALHNNTTPIRTMTDVFDIVKFGASIGKKIQYILEHNEDLLEVKHYLEESMDEDEWQDTGSDTSYFSVTDSNDENESVGSNKVESDSEYETESETESDSEYDTEYETESNSEYDTEQTQYHACASSLDAINKLENSMLTEEDDLTPSETLNYLRIVREHILSTI